MFEVKQKSLIFFLIPLIQVFGCIKYIDSLDRLISFLIFIIACAIVSMTIYHSVKFIDSKYNIYKITTCSWVIVLLVFIDQAIKIILEHTGFNGKVIGEFVMIKQTHNINQTALFNCFNIELDRWIVLLFKVFVFAVLLCLYKKIKTKDAMIAFILLITAQISNILDTIIRNYTLDYIYFYKLTCYDFKDFLVDAGVASFLVSFISNNLKKHKETTT